MTKYFLYTSLACFFIISSCKNKADKIKRPDDNHITVRHQSSGSFSFKLNGEYHEADPAHAKAWKTAQSPLALLLARNDKGLSVSWQLYITGEGDYKIDDNSKGTLSFNINDKTYWVASKGNGDYLDVHITKATEQATVILLSGTFEGVLEDREGNKIQITEGTFMTESI